MLQSRGTQPHSFKIVGRFEMDEDEAKDEAQKTEDFKKLQEELAASKPKGTVRAGPPQVER